jgi:hypothetical protein
MSAAEQGAQRKAGQRQHHWQDGGDVVDEDLDLATEQLLLRLSGESVRYLRLRCFHEAEWEILYIKLASSSCLSDDWMDVITDALYLGSWAWKLEHIIWPEGCLQLTFQIWTKNWDQTKQSGSNSEALVAIEYARVFCKLEKCGGLRLLASMGGHTW